MALSKSYVDSLQTELFRVCGVVGMYHSFIDSEGKTIQGATESEVIQHLTSGRDYVTGRQYRFPGIGNGWKFSEAIEAAGFRIVTAKNYRNQFCRVVTL